MLGYPELRVEFDLESIEALREDQGHRVEREAKLLDRGVLTINEVRRQRNLPDVPWGDAPFAAPTQSAPDATPATPPEPRESVWRDPVLATPGAWVTKAGENGAGR